MNKLDEQFKEHHFLTEDVMKKPTKHLWQKGKTWTNMIWSNRTITMHNTTHMNICNMILILAQGKPSRVKLIGHEDWLKFIESASDSLTSSAGDIYLPTSSMTNIVTWRLNLGNYNTQYLQLD